MVRVENHIFIIGGSIDPGCALPIDQVQCYVIDQQKFLNKKELSQKRGKIGVVAV